MSETTMKIQELPARAYLAHLRRHPVPELMDAECLAALANVEAQFGDTITHGAGLEVRLGNPARYVDYIMCVDQDYVPGIQCIWYEIDYADYLRGGEISPCLFINTSDYKEGKTEQLKQSVETETVTSGQPLSSAAVRGKEFWDTVLPPFAGEKRAVKLRGQLDRVIAALPPDATVKQIGTMSPRGELDILRLVVIFSRWDSIFAWLQDVGWPGDTRAMEQTLRPWKESEGFAVNIDLGESGLLEKTGLEVFGRWRHPLLVDKFIDRLEEAGLCLPSKGEALRRWIRIPPDGDPFIQTLIAYFKLNYAKGRVTEAKAYLEQSPYIHHHYFSHYNRPVRLDMELTDGKTVLSEETALALIRECGENRISGIRFSGGETYGPLERLLQVCAASGLRAEAVLGRQRAQEQESTAREQNVTLLMERSRLANLVAAGASFLIDLADETDEIALRTLTALQEMGVAHVRARWFMHHANAGKLAAVTKAAEESGAGELIVTGMKLCTGKNNGTVFPSREQIAAAAEFVKDYNRRNGSEDRSREIGSLETDSEQGVESPSQPVGMQIVVESCFSPLRAYMEGPDPKYNGNRGIERGCEAGRSFMVLGADGHFAPCLHMKQGKTSQSILQSDREDDENTENLVGYWEHSPALQALRKNGETRQHCAGCCYERRCLPCQVCADSATSCLLFRNSILKD